MPTVGSSRADAWVQDRVPVVASIPSGHVYVRHLAPVGGGGPTRLPDPAPEPDAPASRWWPPVMLDPAWAAEADYDLVHLQFGFDARAPEDLERWTRALRRRGKPFVYTVHDLRNPHHLDRTLHDAHLDVLVPAADRLVTLTTGAAAEIRRRWGRGALVLPHPHVVPLDRVGAPRPARDGFRVGVHLKSLRASMHPRPVLEVLADVVAALPGGVLQVNVHHDVMDGTSPRSEPGLVRWLERARDRERIDLRVHDFLPDDDLFDYLASLDLAVLPYRFGTHSGWLEACRDLGTTVLAPTCGYFADQGPVLTYDFDEHGLDQDGLAGAVRDAHDRRPALGATRAEREEQRDGVARAHDELYRSLVRP